MASFLTTTSLNHHLKALICSTQDRLILISPYLQISDDIKSCITGLKKQKPDIRFVFRENKLKEPERNWLAEQIYVRTNCCPSLHAKCYLNEQEAIITSMNLYEYSQLNNDEMGIHIRRDKDAELYKATYLEAKRLLTISEEVRVQTGVSNGQTTFKKEPVKHKKNDAFVQPAQATGYCIRTGKPIAFDIDRPLSKAAFREWDEFGDPFYPEKYCHFSGEPSHGKNSYDKPILKKNWDKAQDVWGEL